MKYYIADLHFGHQNILSFAQRPFLSTKEMEKILIDNWNKTVTSNDEVYIVGDLFYREDQPERILSQLNGKKTLITGNHDPRWLTDQLKEKYFVDVHTNLEIIDQNHTVFLNHYPMVSYPKQSRAYMIHGHIHNDTLFDYWCILLKRKRILNAGVDINQFQPVTLNELIQNNEQYKQKMLDSYPHYLLSVRLTKNDDVSQHWLKEKLAALDVHELREGIYQINDYSKKKETLQQIQKEIMENPHYSSVIKNFDVVFVDKAGCYSYVSYLNAKTIYIK